MKSIFRLSIELLLERRNLNQNLIKYNQYNFNIE